MALNNLKIIQHNVQAWTFQRRNELYNTYMQEDPDIILLNAHGRKEGENIKMYNYTVYQKNYLNEAHDGTAIAIKKNIKHKIIDDLDENYLAVIINTSLGEICVGTGYQPPRRPQIPLNSILNIMRRNMPAYIIGDLNARHRTLGHNNDNAAGKFLHGLIRDGTVMHLGPDFTTYITGGRSGTPDIVLGNARHLHNMYIQPGSLTTSDHLPVVIRLSGSPIQVPTQPRYKLNKANWDAFRAELARVERPDINLTPAENINSEMNKWFSLIMNAMDKYIPKTRYKTLPHPRTTNEIRNIQQQYQELLRASCQDQWTQQRKRRLRELQEQLQTICRQERDRHWNSMLAEIEADYKNPAKFWRGVQRLMGGEKQQPPYIQDPNGRKLYEEKDQEAEFRRFWSGIYRITEEENADYCQDNERMIGDYLRQHKLDYTPYETIDTSRLDINSDTIAPITLQEVKCAIIKFKKKKAPGISQINKEIITNLPGNMLRIFTSILNASLSVGLFPSKFKKAILKLIPKADKPSIQAQNYRPISLLEAAAKIYERIINNRLKLFLQNNGHNNNRQHSYREKRGTHTALALLYEEIAISQYNKEHCNIVLRDVSKAFDKVHHDGLRYKILRLELPRPFTALLCNFLEERTACIQLENYRGEEFRLYSGVPQGSCLSPTLFNLYVSDLGELNYAHYIQYADDITQVVRQPGRSKEMCKRRTERAIREVNEYEKKWKIKTNQAKFKILHLSKTQPLPIEIDGAVIPFTREARVLGLKLTRTGIQTHVTERLRLAKTAQTKLKRFSNMAPKTKLHLYKALVAPHLCYPPIPLNAISKTNQTKLQTVQNKALRWINGDRPPYHTTVEELHNLYRLKPLNIKNFQAGYQVWKNLREHQPEDVQNLLDEETRATHMWWPRAYIAEDTRAPPPLYRGGNREGVAAIAEAISEEEEE